MTTSNRSSEISKKELASKFQSIAELGCYPVLSRWRLVDKALISAIVVAMGRNVVYKRQEGCTDLKTVSE